MFTFLNQPLKATPFSFSAHLDEFAVDQLRSGSVAAGVADVTVRARSRFRGDAVAAGGGTGSPRPRRPHGTVLSVAEVHELELTDAALFADGSV